MMVNGEKARTLTLNERFLSSKEEKRSLNVRTLNVKSCERANYLVKKFEKIGCKDAETCYNYFVKCFKMLPEALVWDLFESATQNSKIKSPIKYFIAACRNQMR